MTTHNALYDQHHAPFRSFSNGEDTKVRAVSLSYSFPERFDAGDPRIILAYLMILVTVAVLVISGQFPWFISMLAVGLVLSLLFPKVRDQRQRR